jgi:hypothetical protein
MISKIKYEYLLLIIAFSWLIIFSFAIQLTPGFSILGDDYSYLYSSKLLYFEYRLDNTRPLLVSAIYGFPFLFGFSEEVAINWGLSLNFLSWFLTILLIFKIIASNYNIKVAFYIALVFIFCIGNLVFTFRFVPETLFICLIVSSIYFLNKFFKSKETKFVIIAMFILLLNTLIKPVSIGLFLILFLFFIPKAKDIFLNKFAPLLVIGFGLIFFQMYSLKKEYGNFTLSYISAITYYNYLGAKADCYKKNIDYLPGITERTKTFNKLSSSEMKSVSQEDLINQLKENKLNLFKAYLFCIYSNSTKGNYIVSESVNTKKTFYFSTFQFLFKAISKLQNIFFTFIGVLLSLRIILNYKNSNKFHIIISLFLLYIFFISAISCYECDRFHIAFFPIVMMLLLDFLNKNNRTKRFFVPLQK